jgi:6-pyruvoyltetrahydropterin/6-carboxytetrahydropterin synthase
MHYSTKTIELGSCAFRQPRATSHCRFIHGYQLKAKFWFVAETLDENNWVVDFGNFKEFKALLKQQFDHTTCISSDDPKLSVFKQLDQAGVCDLRVMDGVGIEKFAEWCHAAADNYVGVITKLRCRCVKVEVFEHQDNSAVYQEFPESEKTSDTYISSDSYLSTLEQEHHEETRESVETSEGSVAQEIKQQDDNAKKITKPPFKTPSPKLKDAQNKTVGKWVDPKYSGKTKNTWLF